jgi:hypothetical protein
MNVNHGRYRAQDPTAGRGASRTRATRPTCSGCGITSCAAANPVRGQVSILDAPRTLRRPGRSPPTGSLWG